MEVWLTQQGTFEPDPVNFPGFVRGDYRLSNNPATVNDGLNQFAIDIGSNNAGVSATSFSYAPGFFTVATNQPGGNTFRATAFAVESANSGIAAPVFVSQAYVNTPAPNNSDPFASRSMRLGNTTLTIANDATGSATMNMVETDDPDAFGVDLFLFGLGNNILAPASTFTPTGASLTLNISAVPEPTTVLAGLALGGIGLMRLRRKR